MTKRTPLDDLPWFADDRAIGQALLGDDADRWPAIVADFERQGCPKVDPIMGARYVPALHAFFDRKYGALPVKKIADVPGLIYVIGFGCYVKIGFSTNLKSRLAALQTAVPEKLTIYGTTLGAVRADEARLHERFSAYRLEGEWFRKEYELAAWIEAGCQL